MRIALLLWVTENQAIYNDLSYQNKKDYCTKHGYELIICTDTMLELNKIIPEVRGKAVFWYKLLVVLKYIDAYDYVMWQDIDSLIMNDDIKIEDFIINNNSVFYLSGIEVLTYNKSGIACAKRDTFIMAKHPYGICSGCFIAKRDSITIKILRYLLLNEEFFIFNILRPHEESAFNKILEPTHPLGLKNVIHVYPSYRLESWLPVPVISTMNNPTETVYEDIPFSYYQKDKSYRFLKNQDIYHRGDFLLHIGYPATNEEKISFMRYVCKNIIEFRG